MSEPEFQPAAQAGTGIIDGACWRPGDALKHLGPPARLGIPYWSQLFQTRCGLGPSRDWRPCGQFPFNDDDYWCPGCLRQTGMSYVLVEDE